MCGENCSIVPANKLRTGSSPRVRGKLAGELRKYRGFGLIPACAGKTRTYGASPGRKRAHPRVCGENKVATAAQPHFKGSSPRVRGKHSHQGPAPGPVRLIPACAGKTHTLRCCREFSRAHPRVCGENAIERFGVAVAIGSSPRVRGKRSGKRFLRDARGLIPACAGKTSYLQDSSMLSPAHPRVCGENHRLTSANKREWGSSPRVRGKR